MKSIPLQVKGIGVQTHASSWTPEGRPSSVATTDDGTEGTADMASGTQESDTDARKWEYTTYAPAGETCPACMKPIKPLERCRRGTLNRQSEPPVVAYRHLGRCPG